ncbi:hypothetical protein D6745_02940 [Candidatus Woesearchaeota archaeon]|nr:MAG: hypothetical protein D6745_02940 [Candidatus Woesearchaeota archaeon]
MRGKFRELHQAYQEFEQNLIRNGQLPMRQTKDGFWGTSNLIAMFELFNKIDLSRFRHFADLGSGDGRITILAALFTKATGVESDEKLFGIANDMKKRLGSKANFVNEDFLSHDLSKYDFIFMYPDKRFEKEFEEKIMREFKGEIFIYNNIFLPEKLKKGRTYWFDQVPIIRYTP